MKRNINNQKLYNNRCRVKVSPTYSYLTNTIQNQVGTIYAFITSTITNQHEQEF